MSRLNVYLPDELAAEAKQAGLNVSAVTREAVIRTLAARSTDTWLASLHESSTSRRVTHQQAQNALDAERAAGSTRHG